MLNIKKQFVVSLLAISFVILPALAAERPETGSRSEIPDIKGTLKKERLGKDKIKIFGDKAFRRLTEALNRAEGFSERVAFHANQFPNPKFNITLVEQKLNEAKEIIATGRLTLDAIKTAMESAMAGTEKTHSFTEVRVKIREATETIRKAHLKIIEAIRLIKAGYGEPSERSSGEQEAITTP